MTSRTLMGAVVVAFTIGLTPALAQQSTLSGTFGGGTGTTGAGGTTGSTGARSSTGVTTSPRTGRNVNSAGLGTANRIDRNARTTNTNPLQTRGYNVLGGDASQATGATTRQQTQFGPQMFGGAQFGGGLNQQNRNRQNSQRAQYSTRVTFSTPATVDTSARPGLGGDPVMAVQQAVLAFDASSIHVAMEEGAVVLRGTVASEADRRIAEKVAKLEPGVDRVKNELVVAARN